MLRGRLPAPQGTLLTILTAAAAICAGLSASPSQETSHMNASTSEATHTNRLARESSPYLLQHAHNPVHWYPWGEEAFALARQENKPIFLSIGYSACHWCHVMERESFEDEQTAEILNANFVSIKVDREELPDIDEIYMISVQMMTGSGGWPLTVFLTPDLAPFYGGTYFPPQAGYGRPAFKDVLLKISEIWRENPDEVIQSAERLTDALKTHALSHASSRRAIDAGVLSLAASHLEGAFDPHWGGFGAAPKFPPSAAISLLLRQHAHTGQASLLTMSRLTLDRMAYGGMYDQIGGGFHRYSTDERWLVPHFEKMLYDNALLARVYLEAWQVTHNDLYRRIATETLDYVLDDMTDARGGFHSAEDADSEGQEGKFYVWSRAEVMDVLGDEDGRLFCRYYDVTQAGNFEGRNILHIPKDPSMVADDLEISPAELEQRLAQMREMLEAVRQERVRPGRDDKVLASWNGLTISALARAYRVLGEERFLNAAERAADFVTSEMMSDGRLLHTYRAGQTKLPAYLDDYAETINALVDLYEATFDLKRLEMAAELTERMIADFWDDEQGGFHFTSDEHKNLLTRTKPFHDGATPSGNSTAALAMMRLSRLLDNESYFKKADLILTLSGDEIMKQPRSYLNLLAAADFNLKPGPEIVIAGDPDDPATRDLLRIINDHFIPNMVLEVSDPDGSEHTRAAELIPLLRNRPKVSGKPTVYVCENQVCRQPITDADDLRRLLDEWKPAGG